MTNDQKVDQALARIQVYTELIQQLKFKRAADGQLIRDLEGSAPQAAAIAYPLGILGNQEEGE